ncbi:PREDICTED: fasciclin-2 isoform X3 [Vollenhovia emeryi]|uniref:fasciclin-2 isoform X3 n=1 Tax=Vollenhovia emeryi TaxID=411798 RepID=UPI0005F53381|nr:PREDICTED: fasciclin-2 isoform X3 [Vollenhovia emeryi]
MAARQRPTCMAIAVLLLQLAAYASAADPYLEILPSGETQTKPVGSSIILTCKPKVDTYNPSLVTSMEWLDPRGHKIESLKYAVLPLERTHVGQTKPAMYTEMHEDGSLSLFFNSLQEREAGKYMCQGNYARNLPLSKSVTIETIIAITWDDAPLNQFPILGQDYDIKCQVRATPSPSVDWLYNGELITTNNQKYVINTYSLTIKNVQESDDGIYTCRASVPITGELKERPIRVEVHIQPTIQEISKPVDIIEGENANIECKAGGKPPPMISWVKSIAQQNLSNADRFGVNSVTGVLTITNVNREDAGEYGCTAINAAGSASATIRVNVIVKPKIMEFLNKTVVQGKNVDIKCKVFGRPPPDVTFRKLTLEKPYVMGAQTHDDRIVLKNEQDELSGETVATMSITNALTDNDGLYECVAKNTGGVAYKNGHLTVEYPPSFRNMPNTTVWSWEEKPVNLTCIAESIPNATIRWTFSGGLDPEKGNHPIRKIGNGPISTLQITPLDRRYYNSYKCIAMNPHGTREHEMVLREAFKPDNLAHVRVDDTTATTIRFFLELPLTKDLPITSITVQYKEAYQNWIDSKNKTWSVGLPYVIEDLKPATQYEFRFALRNLVGLGNYGNNEVQITNAKTKPREPIIQTSGAEYEFSKYSHQYELSWIAPIDNGEPIDMYKIKYCEIKRIPGDWEELPGTCVELDVKSAGRTRQYLKDLKYDTIYSVELQAHNALGFSDPGFAKFRTARGVDTSVLQHQGPLISSGAIIGIVLAIIFVVFVIIDAICCCVRKTGIINYVRERSRRKPVDEEETKLGRDEKEPLKEEKKITPIIDSGLRRETSVTFDGKTSVSKTGFVGKDSAV